MAAAGDASVRAFELLGCEGFARIDYTGAPRNFAVEAVSFEHVQLVSSNDDDVREVVYGDAGALAGALKPRTLLKEVLGR